VKGTGSMKKLFALLLALLLALFCAACGESGTDDGLGANRSNIDGMNGSGAFDIDTPCEICGGSPSQMFTSYTDGMPDEPAFYCEPCTLTCYFCGGEATTHYNKGLWGEIFTCQDCYDGVHGAE